MHRNKKKKRKKLTVQNGQEVKPYLDKKIENSITFIAKATRIRTNKSLVKLQHSISICNIISIYEQINSKLKFKNILHICTKNMKDIKINNKIQNKTLL